MKLRMEGPYTADVPLQVVCYFKYTPEGAKRMKEAPVELDKELGGVIGGACASGASLWAIAWKLSSSFPRPDPSRRKLYF